MTRITSKKVEFRMIAAPGSNVSVAGTFNNWDPGRNPLKENPHSGHFRGVITVPAGRHEYKFVVNGEWGTDPNCAESVPNGAGSWNSVLTVQA